MASTYRTIALSLVLLSFSIPNSSVICFGKSDRQRLRQADCIFLGSVSDFTEAIPAAGEHGFGIVFQVEKAWRGVERPTITISSPNPFVCGIFFQPKAKYLVFAKGGVTDQTWGKYPYPGAAAEALLAKLGPPTVEVKIKADA